MKNNRTLFLALALMLLVGCAIPLRSTEEAAQSEARRAPLSAVEDADSAENATAAQSQSAPVQEEADAEPANADTANHAAPADGADGADDAEASAESSVADRDSSQAQSASAPTPALPTPTSLPSATEAPLADEQLTYEVTNRDLATEGMTFLEAIDAARRTMGTVSEHRFVEITDETGILWQGESLSGEKKTVLLMQPIQGGGQMAVQITFESATVMADDGLEAVLARILAEADLDATAPDSYGPPDAEIELVRSRETSPGVWSFDVRLNHPDTGWEDYTDGWHVETLDGHILGVRILLHPHVNEMPFTRGQGGIEIPVDVEAVQVRSHDLVSGYTEQTVVVPLGESGSGDRYEVER